MDEVVRPGSIEITTQFVDMDGAPTNPDHADLRIAYSRAAGGAAAARILCGYPRRLRRTQTPPELDRSPSPGPAPGGMAPAAFGGSPGHPLFFCVRGAVASFYVLRPRMYIER